MPTMFASKKPGAQPDQASAPPASSAPTDQRKWPDPRKPSALLVPAYIREKYAARRTLTQVGAGVAALLALAILAFGWSFLVSHNSGNNLQAAEGAQRKAQQQVDSLAPIASYYDGLQQRKDATVQLLGSDVKHDQLLAYVNQAFPSGAHLNSYSTAFGSACAGPAPFSPATGIGCISGSGTAKSRGQVAQWVKNIESGTIGKVLDDPFVSTIGSADSNKSVTFSFTVNFNSKALSMKYIPKGYTPPATTTPTTPTQ